METFKKFLAGFWGRVVMTVLLFAIIWGFMLSLLPVCSAEVIVLIFCPLFGFFGWKALSRITPNVFLIMPLGGWLIYFLVKGLLSLFLGVIVAPFVIAKGLSKLISKQIANLAPHHHAEEDLEYSQAHSLPNSELTSMMQRIQTMSTEELEKIHCELLPYCQQRPEPKQNRDYISELNRFENQKLACKSLYGCTTYGEVCALNSAIVNRLDELDQ